MAKQKNKIKSFFKVILLGLAGAVCGFFAAQYLFVIDESPVVPTYYYFIMFLLFIIAFLVSIALHELGHLITGNLLGFKFNMITVGPLMWTVENEKLVFKWNKNLNLFGGLTLCIPDNKPGLRKKFMWYVAGGPIASLAFASLMFLLSAIDFPSMENKLTGIFIKDVFHFHAFVSTLIFIASIIPIRSMGLTSDGGRLINLAKDDTKAKIELFLIAAHALLYSGRRPAQLNFGDIESYLKQGHNDHHAINCHYYLYLIYLDCNLMEKAQYHLSVVEENLDMYPEAFQNGILLEIIFFQAFAGHHLNKAENLWAKVKTSPVIAKIHYIKAEAALLYLKNNRESCLLKIEEAMNNINKIDEKGLRIATLSQLQDLKSKIL